MKPILFNTEMVKAILDGRKTVTRRIINPRYRDDEYGFMVIQDDSTGERYVEKYDEDEGSFYPCRYVNSPYDVGNILYVRETFSPVWVRPRRFLYKTHCNEVPANTPIKWHPSIHMPRDAARIFLKVTDVRIQRLHHMDSEDAVKEGMVDPYNNGKYFSHEPMKDFISLWDSTIKKSDIEEYGWKANPWVWVIKFEIIDKPNE
jgi:hypothetical protein